MGSAGGCIFPEGILPFVPLRTECVRVIQDYDFCWQTEVVLYSVIQPGWAHFGLLKIALQAKQTKQMEDYLTKDEKFGVPIMDTNSILKEIYKTVSSSEIFFPSPTTSSLLLFSNLYVTVISLYPALYL